MNKAHGNCYDFKKNNEKKACRRTIRNNEKLDHWKERNSSLQMNAILSPDDYEHLPKCECSCDCIEVLPDEVTKVAGKIKWSTGNKKVVTHSRYHQTCLSKKPKPKLKKPNIKRNVPSVNCDQCGAQINKSKFKNQCYCSYPPDKPLLPVKPALTRPNPKRIIRSGLQSLENELESSHTLQTLRKAKDLLHDYSPESEFLKRLRKEAQQVYDCTCESCKIKNRRADFKFTVQRQLLEEAYQDVEKNDQCCKDKMDRHYSCDIKCKPSQLSPKMTQQFSSVSPQMSPITSQRLTSLSSNLVDCDKIRTVKHIRDENYFDTHSTNVNLAPKDVPKHKCVHKFCLDNRLLPTPLNADGFGVSRCTICNKPMESNTVLKKNEENINSEDNYINCKKSSQHNCVKNYLKAVDNKARKINFASKSNAIELQVPSILITDKVDFNKSKISAPTNSWALRYQKGVI